MINNSQEPATEAEPLATPPFLIQRNQQIRNLILDYAMGAALIGLNPFRGTLTVTLLVVGILILKMRWDIGSKWGYTKGQDPLAIAGNLFGSLGAFALAFMAWVSMFCVGLLVPVFSGFAISGAFFTLTWTLGQVTSQFYASGRNQGGQ
ncbi:MAG: hypothetical protein DSM106950_01715 [Stigonema ocellatum SAG 48.90 = DSM 106950]|nr:hypothetical protein [Stigonema ocellatum SAG 48.90 = DSM 106950]